MKYSNYFETKKRQNGDKFFCLKENSPQKLKDLIKDIHFNHFYDCLPNDWIYETIYNAFEELELNTIENINIETDVYFSDLCDWLSKNSFSKIYCDEAIENELCDHNLESIISRGLYEAKYIVYYVVNKFLRGEA